MCTLTVAWQVFADAPVAVAANRDERRDRPSEPPARRDWEASTVAPLDVEAGGTWIGYNEHGLLVAITNRWVDAELPADRSRGLLVRDALRYESAEDAIRYVERELDGRSYGGFNLLAADANAALLVEWDGRTRVRNLDPGVHVVVNVGADGNYAIPRRRSEAGEQQATNADAVRTALRPEPGECGREWLDRAAAVVSDHEYGVCVHGDVSESHSEGQSDADASDRGFGTCSSSLVLLGREGPTYEFADGPPCEAAFERVDARP